jgi:hypothetical protein
MVLIAHYVHHMFWSFQEATLQQNVKRSRQRVDDTAVPMDPVERQSTRTLVLQMIFEMLQQQCTSDATHQYPLVSGKAAPSMATFGIGTYKEEKVENMGSLGVEEGEDAGQVREEEEEEEDEEAAAREDAAAAPEDDEAALETGPLMG